LSAVIEDFIRSREGLGRDHKYLTGVEYQLSRLTREAGWKHIFDITLDSFEKWRTRQTFSPKTLNDYLTTANVLLNWMVKTGRIVVNPLRSADKVGTGTYEKRERRAVTLEQLEKLVALSADRGVIYLLAGLTGLRRGELEKLQWKDVYLDGDKPCIQARATTTKNGKKSALPLHPLSVESLKRWKARCPHAHGTTLVFHSLPRIKRYRKDLEAAGIPYVDDRGQVFDFHALRNTYCTLLQINGVPVRETMELMRHSDQKLTTKIYTDAGHLPLRSSVLKIGSVNTTAPDTRSDTQKGGQTHENYVFSAFSEKSKLTEDDLRGMDPAQYQAFDSQGNVADWALRLLGGGVKHFDQEMVRDAGFEPATLAV